MATYQILYWRDVPAQVKVFEGKRPVSQELPPQFQEKIDQIAMVENLAGSDEYLDQWEWTEKREKEGSAKEVLEALVGELVAEYEEKHEDD